MSRRTLFPILVGALACAMFADAAAQVEYIDPGPGFTQVVTTTNAGVKTIFVSGQVGARRHAGASTSNRRSRTSCGAWSRRAPRRPTSSRSGSS